MENMLRLIRLGYPNSIRDKVFTVFSMETAHDSIKYILPVYSRSTTGNDLSEKFDKEFDVDDIYDNVMYESTESRYATELVDVANIGKGADFTSASGVVVTFKDGAFDADGSAYIDGSAVFYVVVDGKRHALAIQDAAGTWFVGNDVMVGTSGVDSVYLRAKAYSVATNGKATSVSFELEERTGDAAYAPCADVTSYEFAAIGRYDSERDLIGDYMGEVELTMKDYHFRPRPISLGVTWTQLTELVLDTSFGVSAEEMLMDAAGQEIKKSLDFQAVKFGSNVQKVRAAENTVVFDAAAGDATKDSYWHTAQLIGQAISRVGDLQLNAFNRGGVSALVAGPAACNYLALNQSWSDRGRMPAIGGHKFGEIGGIPVFKVPSSIVPDNEILTTWKNDQNENDVSIAIGTLMPFWTSGAIQRKHLYKEAAIARFEDMQALQPKYLGRIIIKNIREIA